MLNKTKSIIIAGRTINLAILLVFALLEFSTTTAQVLEQDSLALVAFYNSTGGPNWTHNNHWLTGPVSTWYGVTVQGDRVIELIINSNNLAGTLPEDLGQLTALQSLGMSNDSQLTGELPEGLFLITTLKWLGIGNCSLTGIIPSSIGNCSFLTELNLPQNNLSGPIPAEICNLDSLRFLDLHDNQLSGTIPLELTNLENLITLELSNNLLSGKIPECLSNLFFLQQSSNININISHNMFSGPIPNSWGNLSFSIDILDISYNNFTSLPPVYYNWLIGYFNIQGNQFTFEHIESHYQSYIGGAYCFFDYYPQASMGVKIDTALVLESNYRIYSGTGGEFTNYKWFKNGELILESPEADSLYLENVSYADTGIYTCQANSSLIYFLKLYRKPVHITIDTSGVSIEHLSENNKIQLYPNPATEFVTIDLPDKSKITDLKILDMNGKSIFPHESLGLTDHKTMINVAGIKPGIYVMQIETENSNYTTKLIINNRGTNR